jgi:hypothetical protein
MQTKKGYPYENSKGYKLIDTINGYFYIGSTCNTLAKRKNGHINNAKVEPEKGF